MTVIEVYEDDHLPCVYFEHKGVKFDVAWVEHKLVGALQLVEDGDLSMAVVRKHWEQLHDVVQDPKLILTMLDHEWSDDGQDVGVSLDYGRLTIVGAIPTLGGRSESKEE